MKPYDKSLSGRRIRILSSPIHEYVGRELLVLKENGNTLMVEYNGVKILPKKGMVIKVLDDGEKVLTYKEFEGSYIRRLRRI